MQCISTTPKQARMLTNSTLISIAVQFLQMDPKYRNKKYFRLVLLEKVTVEKSIFQQI